MKVQLPAGQESELPSMIVECCSQEKTYSKFFGLVGERFAKLNRMWTDLFEQGFAKYYDTIHRYETNRLRNIARFFGHLLSNDAIGWHVFSIVHLNEDETTSSSRIFIKILFQDLAEALGLPKLQARMKDEILGPSFEGLFPTDDPRNTRFSINYFTSIGMGALTEQMRDHLKNLPKPAPPPLPAPKDDVSNSESVSSYSSHSSYSTSRSNSRSRSPPRRTRRDERRGRSQTRSVTGSRSPPRRGGRRNRSQSESVSRSPPPRARRARSSSHSVSPPPRLDRARGRPRSRSASYSSVSRSPPPKRSAARPRSHTPSRSPPRKNAGKRRPSGYSTSLSPAPRRRRSPSRSVSRTPPPRRQPVRRRSLSYSASPPPKRVARWPAPDDRDQTPPPPRRRRSSSYGRGGKK